MYFVYVHVCRDTHTEVGEQLVRVFSLPSTMCILRCELWLSGLVGSLFTHSAIPVAPALFS